MEKYSVFYLTYFWCGILHFSTEKEVLQNLQEIGMPETEWTCNDESHENDQLTADYMAALQIGPGNGATFVNEQEPNDFKNYLHIQRNF